MFFAKIADGVTKEKRWMKEEREENIRINGEKYVKEKSQFPKWTIPVIVLLILAVVVFLIYKMFSGMDTGKKIADSINENIIGTEGEVNTITESTIKDVFEISELQTADYIYNAITPVCEEDGETVKYYVAYEGTVTAGIDFDSIDIDIDDEAKKITITVPDVAIQDAVVNAGTLEYIFKKDKYNNENVFKEAYAKCQEDLDKRAGSEDKLLTMAKENADQVIEALVSPWVEQIDPAYEIEVR